VKRPVFRKAAAADIEDAFLWYEGQRAGLGGQFLSAVEGALGSIVENPRQYPAVHRETHRMLLHRFPYGLFYRIVQDRVVVVACMHASRDPRRWQARE
jgi:plasmid stabilization system protein ParE